MRDDGWSVDGENDPSAAGDLTVRGVFRGAVLNIVGVTFIGDTSAATSMEVLECCARAFFRAALKALRAEDIVDDALRALFDRRADI